MGCLCSQTKYTRHINDRVDLHGDKAGLSLKRLRTQKLVGEALITVAPEQKALEEFAVANRNGKISFPEYKRLLFRLNCFLPKKQLKSTFQEADLDGDGELNQDEFIACFANLDERRQMLRLFNEVHFDLIAYVYILIGLPISLYLRRRFINNV
jgi:hypothetical protein